MPARPPTIRERRLAGELRRLRETSAYTLPQAADELGWNKAKLSRIETAQRHLNASEVQQLLDLYKVDGNRRQKLVEFAKSARQRGWWDAYTESLPTDYATYIGLEAEAAALSCHSMGFIHGLLQTEEYARQVIRAVLMRFAPPSEVDKRVAVRVARQAALIERRPPLRFWTIIDEAALHRQVGGPDVMRGQYSRLLELADLPDVMIQVMPADAGAHPGAVGPFAILQFPESFTPDVVYVESMTSALYIENEQEVHAYTLAFEQMQATALSPNKTINLLEHLLRQ